VDKSVDIAAPGAPPESGQVGISRFRQGESRACPVETKEER
jgi:hypothetical protein